MTKTKLLYCALCERETLHKINEDGSGRVLVAYCTEHTQSK